MLELARSDDWEAINRLSVLVHDLHTAWRPDLYKYSEAPLPHQTFLEGIQNRTLYVAKSDARVIGYVALSFLQKSGVGVVERKSLRIDSICVDESYRGQGIGKQMITDVRALAKAFGCREVILGVYPENDSAIGFYQKCGFRIRAIHMDMKV